MLNFIFIIIGFILIFFILIVPFVWYSQTTLGKAQAKAFEDKKIIYQIDNILNPLRNNPDNDSYSYSILNLLEQGRKYHSYNYGAIYNEVLGILASNPEKIHLKSLCLEIGRRHYANLRPDKKPTIYDEQAIQNDIMVRSK